MTVREFIEVANMYGQQVVRIDDAECTMLVAFEIRAEAKDDAMDTYGDKEVDYVSSDSVEMEYGRTDCISLHLEAEDEDETCPCCGGSD